MTRRSVSRVCSAADVSRFSLNRLFATTPASEQAVLFALIAIVVTLSAAPMGRLVLEGFVPGGVLDFSVAGEVLTTRSTWIATWHSLQIAIGGTIIAVLLGGAVAILVALTDIRRRSFFTFCFVLPLMIPPQVTALAWLQVFGPASPMLKSLDMAPPLGTPNPLHSATGIIFLLGIHYSPLVFLTLRAGLRNLPFELVEAAKASGAKWHYVLRTVVLPLMTPPLIAGVALAFVSCIGNFGIPALLGIPARYSVLTTLIYRRLAGFGPDALAEVAILSVLIGVIAASGILVQSWMLRGRDFRVVNVSARIRPYELGRWRRAVETAGWVIILGILVIPLTGLMFTALVPAYGVKLTLLTATLENFSYVIHGHAATKRAFINSFMLAGGAAVILVPLCVLLAYFLVWRSSRILRVLNFTAELPYALPGVVLAIAAILIFIRPIFGFSIYNTVWIILVAYIARFLTLELRPIISGYHQIDQGLEEAAQMSGAALIYRLRTVILPLVAPAAAAGAILVFLTAFNELTVSALLWSSGAETLGVVVFSLEEGGFSTEASAIAVLTVVVTIGLMLILSLAGGRLPKGAVPWHD